MKTLWIIDHYASEPRYGGISRQYDFAVAIEKYDIRTVVISSSYSHFTHDYFCADKLTVSGIGKNSAFVYLRTGPSYGKSYAKRFLNMFHFMWTVLAERKKIEKKLGKPDAVVGASVHPLAWAAAWKIAEKYGVGFVAEVRDLWPDYFVKNHIFAPGHPIVLLFSAIEKTAYRRAEAIISSLPHADRYICGELGIPRHKFVWIGQPMDCTRFDRNAKRYEELPGAIQSFIGRSFVCVFTGYYAEYEGVYTMLKAAELIAGKELPIKFLFLGSGKEKENMREFVQNRQLKNVMVGGRISKELIPAVLKRSQIHLCELSTENHHFFEYGISKNKLSEYLYAAGVTVFGFAIMDNDVENSKGGITIPPKQPQKMAETIERIYRMDSQERERISESGTQYIYRKFRADILAEKYKNTIFNKGAIER